MKIISQVEEAMVAALKATADVAAFAVPTIESYGGQLDDEMLEWIRVLPAMWVVFAGAPKPKREATGRSKWRYTGTFTVFVAQRNVGGNQALRRGDARNPGTYALLQLCETALLNKDLDLPIEAFQPGAIQTAFSAVVNREAVMVYAMNWHCDWITTSAAPDLAPPGELIELGLQYFLKPGDDEADAADELTMRTP